MTGWPVVLHLTVQGVAYLKTLKPGSPEVKK